MYKKFKILNVRFFYELISCLVVYFWIVYSLFSAKELDEIFLNWSKYGDWLNFVANKNVTGLIYIPPKWTKQNQYRWKRVARKPSSARKSTVFWKSLIIKSFLKCWSWWGFSIFDHEPSKTPAAELDLFYILLYI